jgi:transposase-like protein
MATETKTEPSPPPLTEEEKKEEFFRPQIVDLLNKGEREVKDISRKLGCSQAEVRKIKKQWITDKLKATKEAEAKQLPTTEPSIELQPKPKEELHIDQAVMKAALDEAIKSDFKKSPSCPKCHQAFKGVYAECPECHRTVIPDSELLGYDDFHDILDAILNTVFEKLGASKMDEKELDRGAKCLTRLSQKYRWTLWGMLPEITLAIWGFTVIAPRIGQIVTFLKTRSKKPEK